MLNNQEQNSIVFLWSLHNALVIYQHSSPYFLAPYGHINLYLLVSLQTCMIFIKQEQITSTIRHLQGTRSAIVPYML